MRFLALAVLSATALAQELGITTTHAVSCTRKSQTGDTLSMTYTGTLTDGTQFDSNAGTGRPFEFKLGAGQVIAGWDQGLLGMCIGEGRKLVIPPALGYGGQRVGPIPAGSTLVFETVLLGIKGVQAEIVEEPVPSSEAMPTPPPEVSQSAALPAPTATPSVGATGKHPLDGEDGKGECNLLGDFALLVQGALGLLAVSSLAVKRLREHPRRPMKIWFFDVSKQVFGSVLLHLANILMSMLSSGQFDIATQTQNTGAAAVAAEEGSEPNPCSFYLLNLAIDTTIGIPILVLLLRVIHAAFLHTPLANPPESLRSGNYGNPPRATWWLKQSILYFLALIGMKLCVLAIFALLPWIAWVGDWALRWTEGNTALQVVFVMFVFPLVMNALQYWIVDGFIKDKAEGYEGITGEDDDEGRDEEWLEGRREESAEARRKEADVVVVPKRAQYDPDVDGEGSGADAGKTRVD